MQATLEQQPIKQPRTRRTPGIAQNAAPALPRTYTKEYVLGLLGVTKRTIQRWRLTLGFPSTKKIGPGTDLYLADEVDTWLLKRLGSPSK